MKRVLIIATDGFEQSELMEPKSLLEQAGADITIASPEDGEIRGWKDGNWCDAVSVDITVEEAGANDYDALLLPGGQINPDILRMDSKVIELIGKFNEANKPIAAICHAPWLLAEAGIVRGETVTAWPSIRTDLANAGADVVDKPVAISSNLITSRNPSDIAAFTSALMVALEMERELKAA